VPPLEGLAAERFNAARAKLHEPQPFDVADSLAVVALASAPGTLTAQADLGDAMGRT
jgi:hypothetical protein